LAFVNSSSHCVRKAAVSSSTMVSPLSDGLSVTHRRLDSGRRAEQ
jgi:hypothetical protein